MKKPTISTLEELKKSGYTAESIKDELKRNLTQLLKDGKKTFEKIHGYENSVIPQLERAILAGHNINFLGLRGQAKTRLARQMVNLLDEWIPVIKESEINDDPTSPISSKGKEIIKNHGDKTEIDWIHRSERFYEKLATPDVSVDWRFGSYKSCKFEIVIFRRKSHSFWNDPKSQQMHFRCE